MWLPSPQLERAELRYKLMRRHSLRFTAAPGSSTAPDRRRTPFATPQPREALDLFRREVSRDGGFVLSAFSKASMPTGLSANMEPMPTISRFFGLTITMYFDDHEPPHFHARAAGHSAKIEIDTLDVLANDLPRRELRLVLAWAEMHSAELLENWHRAREGATLSEIEPLR